MRRQVQDVATNLPGMTNREDLPETVNVPVELLKHLKDIAQRNSYVETARSLRDLIGKAQPKPKSRLVAVDLDCWADFESVNFKRLAEQPDLLTLLDEAIDRSPRFLIAGGLHGEKIYVEPSGVKSRIRAALGVTE